MEVLCNNYMPGDPRLVERLLSELKSQGIFDQFRKECISDVDTKPAYQNLRQRVEGTVTSFLSQQTWSIDLNKNQLREQLRKNLHESGFLETGVERIVDQVVNPKISTVFLPKVEDVVYRFLGVEKPAARFVKKEEKRVSITDLLPTDLEAVSPESVSSFKNERKNDSLNDSLNSSGKMEEDESPPFEPLSIQTSHDNSNLLSDKMHIDENSRDSHLSGFSGLQSHESHHDSDTKHYQMDLSNQDSLNSSETHLSIVTSEDTTKMEICEDSNIEIKIEKVEIKSDELDMSAESESVFVFKDVKIEESVAENTSERLEEDKKDKHEKLEDRKSRSLEKSRDKKDDKYKKSSSSKDKEKSSSKYSSKDKDTNKKDPKSSSSHNRDKDKSKERNDKDKSSTRYKYEKEKDKSKSEKDKKVEKSKSDKEIANRDEKERSEKDRSKLDKSKSEKEKSNREKDKYKSDKDKYSKDKEKSKYKDNTKVKSATDKDKDRSSTNKEKSERDKNSKEKSLKDKHSTSKDKNKENDKDKNKNSSSSSSSNSKHGFGKDKKKESNSKEKSSSNKDGTKNTDAKSSDKLKKEETKQSSNRKDSRDSKKKSKDDHYSSKIKKTDRRSTDRDSNDGTSSKTNYLNNTYSESMSSRSENNSQDHSSSSFSGGSGDSGNSDRIEPVDVSEPGFEHQDTNVNHLFVVTQVQPVKYIKPKFASNFEEAQKIMKIRKQLAKLERHNQLSLTRIDVPNENGIANRQASSSTENVRLKERLQNNNSKKTDLDNKDIPTKEVIINTDKIPDKDYINNSNNVETENLKEVTIKNTQLSMKNFEDLEAKLAQVMSKINYNSYESDDDYEFHGYSSSDVVDIPKQVIELNLNKIKSSDNPFQNHRSDNDNLPPTKFEKRDEDSKILNPKVGNTKNHKGHDVCRYLEKPSLHEENNLKFIHNVIAKFEREIKDCIETSRNNFWTANRGKKRKLEECVDFKNNNEIEFTDITPVEHFSLPLSPAESDKSNERKEEDLLIPMKQKRIIRGYSQRYSSDELYKPRPIIGRRNRFPKNTV